MFRSSFVLVALLASAVAGFGLATAQPSTCPDAGCPDTCAAHEPVGGAAAPTDLSSQEARESYSLGTVFGGQLAGSLGEVDSAALLAGIADALGDETRLAPDEVAAALAGRQERELAAQREKVRELAERNKTAGDSYREEFGAQPDVVTLASGLQYKVLEAGDGKVPGPTDVVTVHYRGTLPDGTEFDSSYGQEPVVFPVDKVIPGWSEALQQMSAGSKWQVVIPPDLAYGEEGAGDFIEPNQTLVFEVELIEVG